MADCKSLFESQFRTAGEEQREAKILDRYYEATGTRIESELKLNRQEGENTYLIMIRERNNTCANSQNHTRVNLTMCPSMSILPNRPLDRR